MNNLTKQLGVTLLEVMLVLAVAAMVIVMSIRYYQTANSNQQANALIQMTQGIAAAADSLAQRDGSFSNSDVISANVQSLMPNNSMNTPWGTVATFTSNDSTSYTVVFPSTPSAVCIQASSRLRSNPKYQGVTSASACQLTPAVDFSYTYDSLQ